MRRESVTRQMRQFPSALDWQLVSGYGADDAALGRHYDAALNRRYSKRPLSDGEIAVYAGHRKMMRQFLETGQPFGLFLEDDFACRDVASRWRHLFTHVDDIMVGKDMLKLFDFGPPKSGFAEQDTHGPIEMVKPLSVGAGAVGYLLSREGAQKILSRQRVFRQIDEDIKYFWELGLDIWAVRPQMVREISDVLGGSFLEAERNAIKQRHKNIATSIKGNYLALRKMALNRLHRTVSAQRSRN
ncbi:glycosyltransferase family 25 protein [Hoeflea poritis]|uniref:Glycosyltransferase family 25 protein n=1 Tax=Hoeflea poritis TaxID=2993659 RepID=A0ABT4VMS7_9HYPH|nr:glycosyltransferase family 25 protein [Hoeflea poritis]MDA4846018.1 glycosyltransferase family 25 protein [Hoeflea poritis]